MPFLHAPGLWKLTQIQHKNRKERYFNRKLISARVVSENAYGMLKGRCRFVYKKAECRRHNVKAVIMACINCTSHLCIVRSNHCLPPWQLRVERLNLIESDKSSINWLRRNTTVGDTIRLETNWGDAVRPLGTVMQSFSCAQSDQKPEFTWHFWNSVESNQGLFRPCLKTFVVPFLPTHRLSVRGWCADITMDITKQYHIFLQPANLINNRFLS